MGAIVAGTLRCAVVLVHSPSSKAPRRFHPGRSRAPSSILRRPRPRGRCVLSRFGASNSRSSQVLRRPLVRTTNFSCLTRPPRVPRLRRTSHALDLPGPPGDGHFNVTRHGSTSFTASLRFAKIHDILDPASPTTAPQSRSKDLNRSQQRKRSQAPLFSLLSPVPLFQPSLCALESIRDSLCRHKAHGISPATHRPIRWQPICQPGRLTANRLALKAKIFAYTAQSLA